MSNPVDDFLAEKKTAAFPDVMKSPSVRSVGRGLGLGLSFAAGSGAIAGVMSAAAKMYDAATKKRDFDAMMEANPHLGVHQSRDPEGFNRLYTSLRKMNPEFSSDPLIAGSYMFQGMEGPAETRGLAAVRARGDASSLRPGPVSDAVAAGLRHGLGAKVEGLEQQKHLSRELRQVFEPQYDNEGNPLPDRHIRTEESHKYYT